MKSIALVSHNSDDRAAKALAAALRPLLDLNEYKLWQKQESITAFGDVPVQLEQAIEDAWAVLVLVGPQGVDHEFANLVQGAIAQRIADNGTRFGRIVVQLPNSAELPGPLRRWAPVQARSLAEVRDTASEVLKLLQLRSRSSTRVDVDAGVASLPDGQRHSAMVKHFTDVARMLADGKPLTLMIGPYASVEDSNDGSCPSSVRQELINKISDLSLREMLTPFEKGTNSAALQPLLWQDHLATLCLLSGCTREEIAATVDQTLSAVDGDDNGPPFGIFRSIGAFAGQLRRTELSRFTGLPAVTVLTVCPGLRAERALIAEGLAFERAAVMLDRGSRPELHRQTYRPSQIQIDRASRGDPNFMPDGEGPGPANEVEFVRLVKLFGSRDLDGGVLSGDFGQIYHLLGQLRLLLEDHVTAAGMGPYLLLGGGLGTPPVQAAHAVLLRNALEKPERRPRLVIVPELSASPDPLRQAEVGRLIRLTSVQNTGLDRMQLVAGDPRCFLDALTVALGGKLSEMAAV
jgi:hypothetical protein